MGDNETGLGFPPPHPGEVLREDILPELGITITALSHHLGVKRAGLSELINERKPVTMEMAIRLGKAFNTGTRYWLALQLQYDLWKDAPDRARAIHVEPLELPHGKVA